MSTYYRPLTPLRIDQLFSGALEQCGVREEIVPRRTSATERCLVDGTNYLWIRCDADGLVTDMTRYGLTNIAEVILAKIHEIFGVDIVSEYEPEFWGFSTEEEWEAWESEIAREHAEQFYGELTKYIRGEPNEIKAGTIGETQAKIARQLVELDPTLLELENKSLLMEKVERTYRDSAAVIVKLSPEEMEWASQIGTARAEAGTLRREPTRERSVGENASSSSSH